jgi:hypothetical protein
MADAATARRRILLERIGVQFCSLRSLLRPSSAPSSIAAV